MTDKRLAEGDEMNEENVLKLELNQHTWKLTVKGETFLTIEKRLVPSRFQRLMTWLLLGWKYEKMAEEQE